MSPTWLRDSLFRNGTSTSLVKVEIEKMLLSAGCNVVRFSSDGEVEFERGHTGTPTGSPSTVEICSYRIRLDAETVFRHLKGHATLPDAYKTMDQARRVCTRSISRLVEALVQSVLIGGVSFEQAFMQFVVIERDPQERTICEVAEAGELRSLFLNGATNATN